MTNFWASRLTAQLPEPTLPRADGAAYRAERQQYSASLIYRLPDLPEQRAQAKPDRYVPAYQGLESYQQREHVSAYEWNSERETAAAFAARMRGAGLVAADGSLRLDNINLLPKADIEALVVSVARVEAQESQSVADAHAQLRTILDRTDVAANGHQQLGRAAAPFVRPVSKQGGMPAPEPLSGARSASMIEVAQALRTAEENRQAALQQRESVDQLRSSGDGLIVTNQGAAR